MGLPGAVQCITLPWGEELSLVHEGRGDTGQEPERTQVTGHPSPGVRLTSSSKSATEASFSSGITYLSLVSSSQKPTRFLFFVVPLCGCLVHGLPQPAQGEEQDEALNKHFLTG